VRGASAVGIDGLDIGGNRAGTLTLEGNTVASVENRLSVRDKGLLAGVGTVEGDAAVQGGGTIRPGHVEDPSRVRSDDRPTGTLNIDGDFEIGDGAVLDIGVRQGDHNNARVDVSGDVSIDGGTLKVTDYSGFTIRDGAEYTFLTARGEVIGRFDRIESFAPMVYTFEPIYSKGEVSLRVIIGDNNNYAGEGTPEDPFLVTNTDQFSRIKYNLNSHFVLSEDIDLEGVEDWAPIGSSEKPFTGGFDGNGYVINNLSFEESNTDYVGLFGYSKNAVFRNIGIEGIDVEGIDNVGGLIGYAANTIISECYVTGFISGQNNVGGLIGYLEAASEASISDSYADSNITGESALGGLVGNLGKGASIKNSYAIGRVAGDNNTGGLVGYNNDSSYKNVINSYWDSEVGPVASSGGIGKETAELMQLDTFVEWDFNDVWAVKEGTTYPYLQWQPDPEVKPIDDDEPDDDPDKEDGTDGSDDIDDDDDSDSGCFIDVLRLGRK